MNIIKKILRFISIGLLCIIVLAVIWYIRPQKQEDKFMFLSGDSLAYGQLSIDWQQPGPSQLFDVFWQKMITANPQLNNALVKKIVLAMLPRDILFSLKYDQAYVHSNKPPDFIIIIDLGKKTRLVNLGSKIAASRVGNGGENKAFKIINNLMILKAAHIDQESLPAAELAGLRAFFKPTAREELNIYIPNRQKELSALVKLLEEKNSFAFFPSIDSVEYIQVNGNVVSADQVKGKMSFAAKYIADVDKISMDAFFLNNLLMRSLLADGLAYEGEISSLANFVEINYQVKDLNKIWQQVQ
ncbi:MAG: hypothetical protein PHD29_01615 [bacterium]|nr:hypothetical protein [bacterium]MDD5757297.1 hypothetical protein [bacterium]